MQNGNGEPPLRLPFRPDAHRSPAARVLLEGLYAGALAGAAFGTIEASWVTLAGINIPLEVSLLSSAIATLIGANFGVLAACARLVLLPRTNPRPASPEPESRRRLEVAFWVFLALETVFAALPESEPLWEKLGWKFGLASGLISAAGGYLASRPVGRYLRSPLGAARLVLVGCGAGALAIAGDINDRLLPGLLSARSLIGNLLFLAATLLVLLGIDRLQAWVLAAAPDHRLRRVLAPALVPVMACLGLVGAWSSTRPASGAQPGPAPVASSRQAPGPITAVDSALGPGPGRHAPADPTLRAQAPGSATAVDSALGPGPGRHAPADPTLRAQAPAADPGSMASAAAVEAALAPLAGGRAAVSSAAPASPPQRHPDIFLVVMDTTRADVLTPYGAAPDLTPSLSALARESVVYRRAISPTSWTLPSHATLLTGLYPVQHGADLAGATRRASAHPQDDLSPSSPIREGVPTLATWAAGAGYHTGAVMANSGYTHPAFGMARGFSHYNARPRMLLRRDPLVLPLLEALDHEGTRRLTRFCRSADDIFGEALSWLDDQGDAPVFLMVNLMEPHDPYQPPAAFDHRPGRKPGMADPWQAVLRGERSITPQERAHLVAGYEGAVQYMDQEIGRFMDELRSRGRWENSIIVVVGDHGETFGEHGMMHHEREVWEPLVHVPLIVRYPRGAERGDVRDPVALVDVAPTVLQLAGLPPVALPGKILPRPGESTQASSPLISERPLLTEVWPSPEDVRHFGAQWDQAVFCIYEGSMKYCETSRGAKRLYDLASDPDEAHSLAKTRLEVVSRMSNALHKARQTLEDDAVAHFGEHNLEDAPASIGPAAMERLQSLGYVR